MEAVLRITRILERLHWVATALGILVLLGTCIANGNSAPLLWALGLWGLSRLALQLISEPEERARVCRLFDVVFWVSIIVTCWIYFKYMAQYGVPYESGGTDDMRYERMANALIGRGSTNYDDMQEVIKGQGTGSWNPNGNYVILVAGIHAFTMMIGLEPHTLVPRVANALFLAWGAVAVRRIATRAGVVPTAALFGGFLWGLMPNMLFYSGHIYRDVLVGSGLAITILGVVIVSRPRLADEKSLATKERWRGLGLLLLGGLMSCTLREGLLPATFLVGTIIVVSVNGKWRWLAIVGGVLLLFLLTPGPGLDLLQSLFTLTGNIFTYYTEYRRTQGGTSPDGLATAIYAMPIPLSLPLRLVYASISPLPFPADLLTENFRRLGTLCWFVGLPFLLGGIRQVLRRAKDQQHRVLQGIAITFLAYYTMVAWLTMQDRHLTMYLPFAIVLAMAELGASRKPPGPRIFRMVFIGFAMLPVYVLVKLLQ